MPSGHSFQFTVLGSSGGPFDGATSSYLLKSYQTSWCPNCIVSVDGGSLLSNIASILESQIQAQNRFRRHHRLSTTASNINCLGSSNSNPPSLWNTISTPKILRFYSDSRPLSHYIRCTVTNSPFPISYLPYNSIISNSSFILSEYIASFCLTHPHLDHIAGLVIGTADLTKQSKKRIFGFESTISAIQKHIFNGIIWPNLTNIGPGSTGFLSLNILKSNNQNYENYEKVAENLFACAYPISHGKYPENDQIININDTSSSSTIFQHKYESTAYFIRDEISKNYILIFGDVEPDSISSSNLNDLIWEKASNLIINNKLSAIIIECSYFDEPDIDKLFGHLSPCYLIDELENLNEKVLKNLKNKNHNNKSKNISSSSSDSDFSSSRRSFYSYLNLRLTKRKPETTAALSGLNIIINHVKEDTETGKEPRQRILHILDQKAKEKNLGCIFSIALPGITYLL